MSLAGCPEADQVVALFNRTRNVTNGLPSQVLSTKQFMVLSQGESVLRALVDQRIVGFASVWMPDRFVHHLFVSPDDQSRGVGSLLLSKCEETFGLPLRLKCGVGNTVACAYYQRSGWVEEGRGVGSDGPYINFRFGDA